MAQDIANTLYEMDNLDVLRGINSDSIDLIATDPPFNTQRNRSSSAGFYVDKWKYGDTGKEPDQWMWNEVHPKWLETIQDEHPALYQAIEATKAVQGEDTAAFLCFLGVRLLEMHRILKDTGSIYLHCDHNANAYIRLVMDAIFGKKNFRNEIVWRKYGGHKNAAKRRFTTENDTLLFYSVSNTYTFNQVFRPLSEQTVTSEYKHFDEDGRRYAIPRGRQYRKGIAKRVYLDTHPGVAIGNLWTEKELTLQGRDNERTGSPDQKPVALYERIIQVGSNEGDIVLDPFCGCATTIIAANNLKRRWIGIDRRKDARYHIITLLMGIDQKERKRLEKYTTDKTWLDRQMRPYEMHYRTEPPKRTDNRETAAAELPAVYPINEAFQMTRQEMHQVLIEKFGPTCWGCNFEAPDPRYLELDHINPKDGKDDYGRHHINNRALLCKPCNLEKGNRMTLPQLRKINEKNGYLKEGILIDLGAASKWTWEYLVKRIQETPPQYSLDGL